jgi:DNA repair exonuclease SbcCD ATPase subunit
MVLKKLIVLSAVVAGGLYFVNHAWHGSIGTAWKRARASIEQKINPEFELARIRDQIAQLTPDMHRNIARIAEEMVSVESLDRRVSNLQTKLDDAKRDLAIYTNAIENDTKRVSVDGRQLSAAQVASQVKDKLRTCKVLEREVANTQRVLDAKKQGVEAARQQLAEMKRQKEEMEVLAAEYEAQWKTLQLEQTRSKLKLDDSRLAEIKQSFEKLRERIEVERTKTVLAEQFQTNTLTAPEKKADSTKDVVDEAREYLGRKEAVKN